MIHLPSNTTVGALALVLGALLGAGGYHLLSPEPEQVDLEDRTQIVELDRWLQPRDTSSQARPDREVRYRTRTDTLVDTLFVPIPSGVDDPQVTEARPLEVTSEQVQLTSWDPATRRWTQDIYAVPDDDFGAEVYGLLQVRNPPQIGLASPRRVGAGIGGKVRYRKLTARVEGTLSARLRLQLEAALVYDF